MSINNGTKAAEGVTAQLSVKPFMSSRAEIGTFIPSNTSKWRNTGLLLKIPCALSWCLDLTSRACVNSSGLVCALEKAPGNPLIHDLAPGQQRSCWELAPANKPVNTTQ